MGFQWVSKITLIDFVETEFDIQLSLADVTDENFKDVSSVGHLVVSKKGRVDLHCAYSS